ncbi:MAG: hypothetical protein JW915_19085 [Chitinispirillaceae bacterium]|nr:hypothetical protein [Chitinispirillaceae bacterium]
MNSAVWIKRKERKEKTLWFAEEYIVIKGALNVKKRSGSCMQDGLRIRKMKI